MSFVIGQGQTLVCLGDSITQAEDGYVSVMAALIAARYPERAIRVVNAGIGGNKAPDMLDRLERDVLAQRPDWVTVSVGINDVWHGLDDPTRGVSLADYEPTVEQIVSRLQEAGAQVALVTPTVIGEETGGAPNQKLAEYTAAMERIAQRRGPRIAPTHSDFLLTLRTGQAADPQFRMTTDGVHLNAVGNARMALTILETLGF
jgi:acyl-CoA thioesterase-1